jgi:hypothetical protein
MDLLEHEIGTATVQLSHIDDDFLQLRMCDFDLWQSAQKDQYSFPFGFFYLFAKHQNESADIFIHVKLEQINHLVGCFCFHFEVEIVVPEATKDLSLEVFFELEMGDQTAEVDELAHDLHTL